MKRLAILSFVLLCACGSSSKDEAPPSTPSGSAPAPAADAASMAGSGSGSATGSGSNMAAAGSGSGSAAAGSGSGSGDVVAKNDFDFDKLTHDQKVDFMKKQVMPAMKKTFQEFDAKHYKDFNCKTCHGKDPKKSKFKMPTPDLPKLDFAALKAGKQKPKIAEWMGKVVKPQMAKILNQPEYTEDNPKGFGCLECHEQKK